MECRRYGRQPTHSSGQRSRVCVLCGTKVASVQQRYTVYMWNFERKWTDVAHHAITTSDGLSFHLSYCTAPVGVQNAFILQKRMVDVGAPMMRKQHKQRENLERL